MPGLTVIVQQSELINEKKKRNEEDFCVQRD